MRLPATPKLGLAVHNDLAAGDQTLGICAARDDPGELEQLAKPDHVAGDLNRLLHSGSVPGFVVRSVGDRQGLSIRCTVRSADSLEASMSPSVALGLVLALLTAFGSVAGFLYKFKGARSTPEVELRRPIHSTVLLFRSPVYLLGIAIGLSSWVVHVGALALAPISLAQATVAGGLVLLTVAADRAIRHRGHAPRVRIGVTLTAAGLAALAATLDGGARSAHSHYAGGTLTVFLLATAGGGLLVAGLFSRRASALAVAAGLLWAASDTSIKALGSHLGALGAGVLLQPLALVIFLASMAGLLISARSLQLGDAVPMILLTSAAANLTTIASGPIVFGEPLPDGQVALVVRLVAFALVVVAASLTPPPVPAPVETSNWESNPEPHSPSPPPTPSPPPLPTPPEHHHLALVSPPVAPAFDVVARILAEIGRTDDEDLETPRPGFVASPHTGRDTHRVPFLEVDDLVVDLHPPAPAHHHVHLLLLLVGVAVRKAVAGRYALVGQAGLLELERLGRRAELQVRRAVEVRAEVLKVLLEVPEREWHGLILKGTSGRSPPAQGALLRASRRAVGRDALARRAL